MEFLVVPRIYTVMMFGISIGLWVFLTPIPIYPGTPIYLQHPLFMLELLSLLSTLAIWVLSMPVSVYSLRKQNKSIIGALAKNAFVVSLAFVTIAVAISGCVFFSETIPNYPHKQNDLWVTYGISPNPFGQLYGLGILCCEAVWIINLLVIVAGNRRAAQ